MPVELKMPALSPTMEKGTLANWLVAEGDTVKPGDLIAEIETDKATMEFEAVDEGRIAKLVVPAGTEDVAVGSVIALLAEAGEDIAAQAPAPAVAPPPAAVPTQAVLETIGGPVGGPPAVEAAPVAIAPVRIDPQTLTIDEAAHATPLARRIAAIRGIALDSVTGTGPKGKIVKADLGVPSLARNAAVAPSFASAAAPASIAPPPEGVPVETVKLSSMRKTIARRLTESKTQVPHFYLTARCNLDPLLALRGDLNRTLAGQGLKLSVNDMLVKALAMALVRVPDANVQFGGDVLHRFGRADVAMAVAIEGGLVTPVIRGADTRSLSAIAMESKTLATKAREGKLTPEDYTGGTASLSNLGMFGIDEMFPVINPPQALILGAAAGIEQPWNVGGELKLATVMAATASFDHRAIDGATAAQFMAAFRELVEQPLGIAA